MNFLRRCGLNSAFKAGIRIVMLKNKLKIHIFAIECVHNMTNNEFWLSIREIIDNGFSDEGLAKLDEYAEQFISGRLVYKRFSPAEQHGCDEEGTNHVIASILAGAEVGSDKCTAPIGSFKRGITRKYVYTRANWDTD